MYLCDYQNLCISIYMPFHYAFNVRKNDLKVSLKEYYTRMTDIFQAIYKRDVDKLKELCANTHDIISVRQPTMPDTNVLESLMLSIMNVQYPIKGLVPLEYQRMRKDTHTKLREMVVILLDVCPALVTDTSIEYGSYCVNKIPDILTLLRDADPRDGFNCDQSMGICPICLSAGETYTRIKVCDCKQYYHIQCVIDLITRQRHDKKCASYSTDPTCPTCTALFNANEVYDYDHRVYFPRLGIYPRKLFHGVEHYEYVKNNRDLLHAINYLQIARVKQLKSELTYDEWQSSITECCRFSILHRSKSLTVSSCIEYDRNSNADSVLKIESIINR